MTTRAAILAEIETRLAATGIAVDRNPGSPGSASAAGKIFMGDGDPGEPSRVLGIPAYTYTHDIPVEVEAPGATEAERLALANSILALIALQFPESDVDLGGLAETVDVLAPRVRGVADAEEFSPEVLIAAFTIRVTYTTEHSLAV